MKQIREGQIVEHSWTHSSYTQDFAKDKLGVTFNDIQLLITAFTHRSYLNEHKKTVTEHNERLEFLGDAVWNWSRPNICTAIIVIRKAS